jgi:alpha-L-rhamnosidase
LLVGSGAQAATIVERLRCEGFENPMGIDRAHPQLSWILQSGERDQKQAACQILVASSAEKLARGEGDLWDSGQLAGDQSVRVPYAGKPLSSGAECFWKVRVWLALSGVEGLALSGVEGDTHNKRTEWSSPAKWSMGLLAQEDWKGSWITASKWFVPPGSGWGNTASETDNHRSWVRVDLGQSVPVEKVRLVAMEPESFPLRFRIEADDDFEFSAPKTIADCSGEDYRLESAGIAEFSARRIKARYVRILVFKSPLSKVHTSIAADERKKAIAAGKKVKDGSDLRYQSKIRQLEVISGGRNVARHKPTTESEGFFSACLVDGAPYAPVGKKCPPDACAAAQAPMLRKAFTVDKPVRRAVLYYAAHGMAEMTLNGASVDDTVLGPAFSDYFKRIEYRAVDVTNLLADRTNVLGAVLGNGFFSAPGWGYARRNNGHGQPRLLAQLEMEFQDGTRQRIVSDQSWRWAPSEITKNDVWQGYEEDRRLATPDWNKPGFDDSGWQAVGMAESLGGRLSASIGPPVRVLGQLKPVRVEGDTAIFDVFTAGWPRVVVANGKAGQTITFTGEPRIVPCRFTLAQDGPAVLEPKFIWSSGPLKLKVEGLVEPLTVEQVSMRQVGADLRSAGAFRCSNPFLNQLHEAVLRTHLNYNLDLPMDPMREKQAWTQDAQNFFNTAVYLTDVDGLYRKFWWDMADNQTPSGLVGSVVPVVGGMLHDWNCPWWSGAVVWLPWEHYLYYGDRRFLEESYGTMRAYVDFLDRLASAGGGARKYYSYPDPQLFRNDEAAKERMLIWGGAGDWMRPADGPPNDLLTTLPWYHYARIVSRTAALLGKRDEAAQYAAMAEEVRQRINAKFLDPATGLYGKNPKSQSSQLLPLALGVVPEAARPLTQQRLLEAVSAHKDHHACGFVSLTYLFQVLTESYETVVANRIVNQNDYPSWKTLMHDGVLFENWQGGHAQMPSCGGAVGRWFYEAVLGIRPDPAGPGFKRFILAPQPDPATGLTQAEGWYDSPYGRIVSKWAISGDNLTLEIIVPANTVATVRIPTSKPEAVREGGRPVAELQGVKVLRQEPRGLFLEVGGGCYRFAAAWQSGSKKNEKIPIKFVQKIPLEI